MTIVPRYVIDPHKGAGPFRFGTARSEVGPIMGVEARTIDRRPNGGSVVDIFFEQGVQILYDPNERIGAIHVAPVHEAR
jgi:hypothetical protein